MSPELNVVRPLAHVVSNHDADVDYGSLARRLYRERRARTTAFHHWRSLFGEPAWDILLELYVAGAAGHAVCVGNACIAADVAQTTGLRWVGKLEKLGLVTRHDDPADGRRGLVALTGRGRNEMEGYLRRLYTNIG
ncbi:MAG: MarR family winged helix-turn-helix transcriptional regulator [Sphingomonas sp.]